MEDVWRTSLHRFVQHIPGKIATFLPNFLAMITDHPGRMPDRLDRANPTRPLLKAIHFDKAATRWGLAGVS